ncbi:hypothetical protein [Aquibacillus rhizosphaerae]|uniref:Uncharacterized protein n=1 Tax=Aquibacillus rhizosphaerae TaxID=3051431 RepID=A0ABT7L4N9_9BACI|nr:hypothetical protein [Aquibacillus sp. LR5S19]MDL4840349.1 hypothetical protein [Aquibacillus sp. LR5S19]
MTMVLAYTWKNKAVVRADSREHAHNDKGEIVSYNDDQEKIIPAQNHLVFAHAGLRKVHLGESRYFDNSQITEYFIEQNQSVLSNFTSEQLLNELVTMWNRTLREKLGRDPFSVHNRFSILFARFENDNGVSKPKIHTYQSHFQEFQYGGRKAIVGDDECYPIIMPYFQMDTDDWTFDETLEFYLRGFAEVTEKVETIGGEIDIFVLDENPECSHWFKRKTITR